LHGRGDSGFGMVSVPTTGSVGPFLSGVEPFSESDDELRAILSHAVLPPLLPALAYATGDMSLLRAELRPDALLVNLPGSGLTDEQAAAIRKLALEALIRFRDGGCRPAPVPSDHDVLRIMEFAVGGDDMAPYLPLLEEELAHGCEDRRAPAWHKDDVAPDVPFTVGVIGAGLSGLVAGHRLRQAGVDFVILEKNHEVGGTWWENQYPGCRVDNPNHNYSYSFAQRLSTIRPSPSSSATRGTVQRPSGCSRRSDSASR
jgi:4-hydroxyacetophenone monooxygenase